MPTLLRLPLLHAVPLAAAFGPPPPPLPITGLVSVSELALCPNGFAPIEVGAGWDGLVGRSRKLCLERVAPGSNHLPVITRLRGSNSSTGQCPGGLSKVGIGASSAAFLCATVGSGSNATDPLSHIKGSPGDAPHMTVCHGYSCTAQQQGMKCLKGTPGASDRDFRCCSGKMLSGKTPGSPAPKCSTIPQPPNATVCHGFSCTAAQQNQYCPKGTPGAVQDFRCCAGKWLDGPTPDSPAPECSLVAGPQCSEGWTAVTSLQQESQPFLFHDGKKDVAILCTKSNPPPPPPCPAPAPRATGPITALHVLVSAQAGACCPADFERVGSSDPEASPPPSGFNPGDFNAGAGGSWVYLCAGRGASRGPPITGLVGFSTPSAADPFMDCPAGWNKVTPLPNSTSCVCEGGSPNDKDDCFNCENFNAGSANRGAMYLCAQTAPDHAAAAAALRRPSTTAALTALSVVTGNRSHCPDPTHAVQSAPGIKPVGAWDFNPRGLSVYLCATVAATGI